MKYKIYFAGSIRGGRDDKDLYNLIIKHLNQYGQVLTEHVGHKNLTASGEKELTDNSIYQRDMDWIKTSDIIIVEVSTPSLGVGYEIGKIDNKKPVLCLYRFNNNNKLSAMIAGNPNIEVIHYQTLKDAKKKIDIFFNSIN